MTDLKQDSAPIERPPAPEGSIYVQDILDIVRPLAEQNRWCGDAEFELQRAFERIEQPLELKPTYDSKGYCCYSCNDYMNAEEWAKFVERNPEKFVRFVLVDDRRDMLVTKADAVRILQAATLYGALYSGYARMLAAVIVSKVDIPFAAGSDW